MKAASTHPCGDLDDPPQISQRVLLEPGGVLKKVSWTESCSYSHTGPLNIEIGQLVPSS